MLGTGRALAGLFLLLGLGLLIPSASSAIVVHAHRGGPNVEGEARFGENSISAFRYSAEAGFVVELDLARTSDGVAVAMHDDDLDRTTDCAGDVVEMTWADLASCRIDRIGIGDARQNLDPGDPRLEPVPSLSQVIDLLKETGAKANIEVKDIGSDQLEFPHAVYAQLESSGLPSSQVILQNFSSAKLANAASIYPGVTTSQLTVELKHEATDQLIIDAAVASGCSWMSPLWPITAGFESRIREAGLLLVPWTIDDPDQMVAAAEFGVDGVITNDPTMAKRLIGMYPLPDPDPDPEPKADLSMKLVKGKIKARPRGTISFKAEISNSGDAASGSLNLHLGTKGPLNLVGKWPRSVDPLEPGQSKTIQVRVKVKAKAGKAGSFRLRVRLSGPGSGTIEKALNVRVLRSRR